MRSIALGLLALFAVALSSGVALAGSGCSSQVAQTKTPATVASAGGSTPIIPSTRDGS